MKFSKKLIAGMLSASIFGGMVSAPIASFAAETDQLDVAVISDIEYQADAADADGLILSKSAAMLDAAIAKVNAANPDVVLLTGDLTRDGSQASHTYVAGKLAEMWDTDTQVYVIPGEKDVAKSGVNPGAISDDAFRTTYKDFGYDETDVDNIFPDTDTLSYIAFPIEGYNLLMLDSVAAPTAGKSDSAGQGAINKTWALAQLEEAANYGDFVIGAAHHPSISRGSVEGSFIDLIFNLENLKDANGNKLYDGAEQIDLINMVDKSAFSYKDMMELSDAGLNYIYTGHNYMSNSLKGASTSEVTNADGTVTTVTNSTWTDINVGSLVAASAAVTFSTYDRTAATVDDKLVSNNVDRIATVGGANVRDLVMAAQQAYTPAMIDNMIEKFKGIYPNLITILKNVAPKFVDGYDFGSDLSGDITASVMKPAIKNLFNDVLALVDTWAEIEPALNEIKTALLASTVGDKTMTYVLSDVAVQLQENHELVAPSLRALVEGLKAETPDTSIVEATIKDFANKLVGTETMKLINSVLDQNLKLTLVGIPSSNSIRQILNGPVKFFGGIATVDLWAILDGIQPMMPDGVTPVPQSAKPSEVGKPLVKALLMKSDGSTQDVAGFKAAIATGTVNLLQNDNVTRVDVPVAKVIVDYTLIYGIPFILKLFEPHDRPVTLPVIPPVTPPDVPRPTGNLILNSGFEEDLTSWTKHGAVNVFASSNIHCSGSKSAAIQLSVMRDFEDCITQSYHSPVAGTVTFSAKIKTSPDLEGIGAILFIEALDAQNNVLISSNSSAVSNTNGEWQLLSTALSVPMNAKKLVVKIGGLYCQGTFYVDDTELRYS